jgi:hypothetical protein
LTTASVTHPSSPKLALQSNHGVSTVPLIHPGSVTPSYSPHRTFNDKVVPLIYLLNNSNGHHVVCFTTPDGVVISGLITFTLCAIFAMPMYLLCRMKTLSQTATASASESVYDSSAPSSPGARTGSHTFHSSKQIVWRGTVVETLFSMRARSISDAVISIARSALRGADKWLVYGRASWKITTQEIE